MLSSSLASARRPLALALLLLAAAACSGRYIDAPATNQPRDSADPQRLQPSHLVVADAPIRTADNRFFDIKRVVIRGGDQYLSADASDGLDRYDQNRLPLADVPIVGRVFLPRLHEADFRPNDRVGEVFAGGDTLHVVLDVLVQRPEQVVIVHRDYAYALPALRKALAPPPTPGGRPVPVGAAYSPRPGLLLLLIRPSTITDTPL